MPGYTPILMGDMVRSRSYSESDWQHFERVILAAENTNAVSDVPSHAVIPITQISGDGFGAVYDNRNTAIDSANRLFEELLPLKARMVIVEASIDTSELTDKTNSHTALFNRLRGEGLIKAAELLNQLKSSKALFDARLSNGKGSSSDPSIDERPLIADTISLLWLEKTRWTARQLDLIKAYRQLHNQQQVAQRLNVSPQYVSNQLKKANLTLLDTIEARWKEGYS